MKYGDKLLAQIVICLSLMMIFEGVGYLGEGKAAEFSAKVKSVVSKNYTLEQVQEAGNTLLNSVLEAPDNISTAIMVANEVGDYSAPMDEKSDTKIKSVHATGGGKIIYAGIDKELGVCVRIEHEDKISTYGNMYTLTAVTGERVKKGDIIGTYDTESNKEFYYQLENSVVY